MITLVLSQETEAQKGYCSSMTGKVKLECWRQPVELEAGPACKMVVWTPCGCFPHFCEKDYDSEPTFLFCSFQSSHAAPLSTHVPICPHI